MKQSKPLYNAPLAFLGQDRPNRQPIAFVGIPYDKATTYRPGACFGPQAIRAASLMLTDGDHPIFDVDPCSLVGDYGNLEITTVAPEKAVDEIARGVAALIGGKSPIKHAMFAGGDHLVTLGILRGMASCGLRPLIIHFDAHCDTWPDHFGERIGHGTWVRNVIEEGFVDPKDILSVGLRSSVDRGTRDWLQSKGGNRAYSTRYLLRDQRPSDLFRALLHETFQAELHKRPIYVSFDIDVLDPSIAPGTGTPEPGGLPYLIAEQMLETLADLNLFGMDLVEVAPAYDNASETTALCGARLLWTFAAMVAAKTHPEAT